MRTTTLTIDEARALRASHDADAKLLSRQTKAQLKAIRYHRGLIHIYGEMSKDELISSILDARYPLERMHEAIHVLHHRPGEPWSACEWCEQSIAGAS